ncbi:MAG TPA: tyrosine-type recombinase/integrase [Bryobacteraceae bacterium]|nr:tyrosine-type recombinase/integrase [Bryobacteraceae bacterium]
MTSLPNLVQRFFTDRLCTQLGASPNTIAAYRDTFRLLLRFASQQTGKPPTKLTLEQLDVTLVTDFLTHMEDKRGNSARSRNARLASIRSFFGFVAVTEPAHLMHCQQVLAIPGKRHEHHAVEFLNRTEMDAVIAAPDRNTWIGRRDHAILSLALQTGLRVSEITGLRRSDLVLGTGAYIRCEGKGRKQRCTPLRQQVTKVLSVWLKERAGLDEDPLFPTMRGTRLSRDAIEQMLHKYVHVAAKSCPSLGNRRVTPHVLRHSTAMDLLHHGVDQAVIALWLGHESVQTTQIYVHADMRLKEKALARVAAPELKPGRYRPDDTLLAFLESL